MMMITVLRGVQGLQTMKLLIMALPSCNAIPLRSKYPQQFFLRLILCSSLDVSDYVSGDVKQQLKLKDLELRLALSSRPNRLGCRVSHDDETLYVSKLIHEGDFPRICISSMIYHHLCLYGPCRALASLLGRGFLILLVTR
jgi:hypothetical protein